MSHDHLAFLKFGDVTAGSTAAPGLRDPFGLGAVERQKTPSVIQAEIVTYLQRLTAEQKVAHLY